MKAVLSVTLVVIGVASGFAQSTRSPDLPRIERFQVGKVVLGASAEDVYEAFSPDRRRLVDLGYEGQLNPALELTFPGATLPFGVVAELGCQAGLVVSRIQVRDPAFRTARGVGVGSSVGQLRAGYRLGGVLSGEGNVVIRVEELSASFEIDQTGPGGANFWRLQTAETIPDSVKIISILLTK